MNDVKTLTIEQVFDYLRCPLQYHIKHERQLEVLKEDRKQDIAFKEAFHQTIYYYFNSLQAKHVPSLKQMYEKFAKLWHEKSDIEIEGVFVSDLAQSTRDARIRKEKYLHKGYKLIKQFYEKSAKEEYIPIAVNHEYRISFGNLNIVGKFELIRERVDKETQSRFIEVVDFRTGLTKPEGFFLRHDLNATFMHYAFTASFKKMPDAFIMDYVGAGKEIVFERNENDYKRLVSVLKGVANGIDGDDIFPRHGYHCKQCPFQSVCDRWTF